MGTVADGLRASGIDVGKQGQYEIALKSVFPLMTEKSLERVARHVKKITFYTSVHELMAILAPLSKEIYLGMYDPRDQTLHLDGVDEEHPVEERYSAEEIYAHELAHVVDGPYKEISNSNEWKTAWEEEIVQMKNAELSRYAKKNSAEGFAEFGRRVYGGAELAAIEKDSPNCFRVWKSHALVD